ncbi:putative F-box protein At1g49610 isoform X3 [Salvia miltiorrhiza]|uniref:putative F-box protein At1g49610 isoform X3 n=1 Tax=Salvia miltiorrhiza TaxID=226208 RepID=UPI0025ABCE6E|nr:putative F-box protein At1g49610 isoform X3 [Salvia miltiorrhiza]
MDRLSELPDSLIFHIFWSLPMTDVVRTTILSKRWKNLWTTAPYLNFDNAAMGFEEDTKLRNFVDLALLRWNGLRVLKFKFTSGYEFDEPMYLGTDLWVQFAKDKGVEELYLHILFEINDNDDIYWVPQCVYSCSSLKVLSFEDCNLRVYGNVQWNHLKSLTIINGDEVTERVINQILCGSPRLEVLIMSFLDIGENLCIQSTSLKVLSIHRYFQFCAELCWDSELRICTPNLHTLEIKGAPYKKCLLVNVSSLTHATLAFFGLHCFDVYDVDFPGMDTERGLFTSDDFLGDVFCQILSTIQHVENVTLMFCCIKVLGAMIKRCMNSSFPNVKSLQLGFCFNYKLLVGLLESFPQLKKLVLNCIVGFWMHENQESLNFDAKSSLKFEAYPPESFLQLRTVEVIWDEDEDDEVFPFLEFLLKYASNLEKMVFRVRGIMPPKCPSKSLFRASQKLLRMPRSSPTAQLIFCEY